MSFPVKLNSRQQQVFGATVRYYIATAKPVGSEALLEEFNPRVSSATIRNAMGYLEKAGLLYQPHTSAGRIPSDSGYRLYVDQLVTPSDTLARQVAQTLTEQLNWEEMSLESLLRGAAQILSTLSGYIALVTLPQSSTAQLKHLQLVQLDSARLMLIVVLDTYETQSTLVDLPLSEDEKTDSDRLDRELQILSNFLNSELRGRTLSEIATLDWTELGREFDRYATLLQTSLLELNQRRRLSLSTQILINGVAEVLKRQPEFSELQQVQPIVHLLESEQDQLWSLIFESADSEGTGKRVSVRIGAENPLEPMRSCALVSATYQRNSIPVGSVGMLGPTRMVYENAIAMVEAAADYLSEAISQSRE
ncbi:heat-inducible transcriptional repressor HrcA [Leptolyngbya sp. FACHB-711]|uniref:heat-inducible transcriptional repressor HrcA n=1 Tax=unclassified Leptolyngbya TaxID=2650499 RepID=UPI0016858A88|nr:heat-inducible transcriptional repressor HrcA [Leptolyngbya sp. FACHB-711]MBD1851869.1 heat-inducible transcriptional repressor HrcA [Cyanobacteria bacterium FACHB-502]MBD2025713.1 heat-inducible transcriptional repressor HrcA [Leptolyngbya sp. FACHB-711]